MAECKDLLLTRRQLNGILRPAPNDEEATDIQHDADTLTQVAQTNRTTFTGS